MIDWIPHLFVWIASPAALAGTALYAAYKGELLLGTLASFGVLMACAVIANWLFDGHLLFYLLVYGVQLAVPAILMLCATGSFLHRLFKQARSAEAPVGKEA